MNNEDEKETLQNALSKMKKNFESFSGKREENKDRVIDDYDRSKVVIEASVIEQIIYSYNKQHNRSFPLF